MSENTIPPFSPAPWHKVENDLGMSWAAYAICNQHKALVAYVVSSGWGQMDAGTANLIVAAPKLLEALREVRRVVQAAGFKSVHPTGEPFAVADMVAKVNAAIAEAEARE